MEYTEVYICQEKRPKAAVTPSSGLSSPPMTSEDEGRGSAEPQISPVLKSDVKKFEKNLEPDPEEIPKKWDWNWPNARLTYLGFKGVVNTIRDKPRYGYMTDSAIRAIFFSLFVRFLSFFNVQNIVSSLKKIALFFCFPQTKATRISAGFFARCPGHGAEADGPFDEHLLHIIVL